MELLSLFDSLSSESESERGQAFEEFEQLFKDPTLYNALFDILSESDLDQKYYILASECLLIWFRRTEIKDYDSEIFIQKLQPFLLIDHPAQKELWDLYKRTINYYASEVFIIFLEEQIDLISVETPPEQLVYVLKLSNAISRKFRANLNSTIHTHIIELFSEINDRLVPILQNAHEYISSSIGCSILCYSFKTIFYSKKCKFNEEFIPHIFNCLNLILEGMMNITDHSFYSLVKFSYRIIDMFRQTSTNLIVRKLDLTEEQQESIYNEINSLLLQFVISIAPYHVDAIYNFLVTLYLNSKFIPETAEIYQSFVEIATLTEDDLSDFNINPSVFYEYAYSSSTQSNSRRICYDLVNQICHDSKTNEFLSNIISHPPCEASMYLVSSIIIQYTYPSSTNTEDLLSDDDDLDFPTDMREEVFQWIVECVNQQIPFQSPLEMSTFLYLVSKVSSYIVPDDFLEAISPLVYVIIASSVMENVDDSELSGNDASSLFSCSKDFIDECSKCLVTVTNAVRVARKIIIHEAAEFPPEMLQCIVELAPNFPTSDSVLYIKSYIGKAQTDPEKIDFFMSQVEEIKSNICATAMSALSSACEFNESTSQSNYSSNLETKDYKTVSDSLFTLNEIITCEGEEPNITDEMVELIESSAINFDENFQEEFINIITTLYKIGFPGSPQIIGILTETISSNPYLLRHINYLYTVYIFFMYFFPDFFIEMEIASCVTNFGIEAFKSNPDSHAEESTDLICFSIQTDTNFDVSPIIKFVDEQYKLHGSLFNRFGLLIMMSIVVSRPQEIQEDDELLNAIIEWANENNAKCPYEKRLAALSLMILNGSDDVIQIVIDLLSKEKNQRELLARAAEPPCHCYPTQIEQIDLYEVAQIALEKCSPENQKNLMNSISALNCT